MQIFRFLCSVFSKYLSSYVFEAWISIILVTAVKWSSSASRILRFLVWTHEKIDDYSISNHLWETGNLISSNLVSITKSFCGSPGTELRGIFDILTIRLFFLLLPCCIPAKLCNR